MPAREQTTKCSVYCCPWNAQGMSFSSVCHSASTLQISFMPAWRSAAVHWIWKDACPLALPICRGLWFCTLWSSQRQVMRRGGNFSRMSIFGGGISEKDKLLDELFNSWKSERGCANTLLWLFSLKLSLLSVWLQRTLPWGTFSSLRLMNPTESDDGPIMWVRPGEQMIPVADIPKSPFKRKRWVKQHSI